ncbi:hypothetical protein SBM3_00169 [Synechococcus phage S-BM3]|nr:hypothetical protein SBM3_00169 [Synechococcus phage S-BM3]
METTVIDAIISQNNASAVERMKDMLSDKALEIIDAKRQAVSQQMFGDAIGAEPAESEETEVSTEAEAEVDTDVEASLDNTQEPEEEQDETDHGTD